MHEPVSEYVSRGRFLVMNAVRLAGVVMVGVGILIVEQVIPEPAIAGYVILVVGLFDIFAVPLILARKWRTPVP